MNSILFHGENRIPIVIEIQILPEPNINPNVFSSRIIHSKVGPFMLERDKVRPKLTVASLKTCFVFQIQFHFKGD